jgi:S-methylmethionine-dependent homocysteine/selenocysteine methylase
MDPTPFRAALRTGSPVVLDGGLATELEAMGEDLSDALWSARLLADAPHRIEAAHLAFFRAGARVATTASYQATFQGFAARGIGHEDAAELIRRSVTLADLARSRALDEGIPGPLFVAASVGPYGAFLADGSEYRGGYGRTMAWLRDFHRRRLEVLASTEADVLAVETIPEIEEAVALASLIAEHDGAAAWISFSCADGARIRSGAPIEEAVASVAGARGVVAVGVNCTAPEHVPELIERIRTVTGLPLIAYPNSGEGWDAATRTWTGATGADVDASAAAGWVAAGARLVGGCCRVGPARIASIAAGLGVPAA